MNYLFSNLSRKFCCDAIVRTKCVNLKVFILINNQQLSTANAKNINTDYYCSDFISESNGIFVLGVVFILQTNFDFSTSHF